MRTNAREAKTRLLELVTRAERREEVVITRYGRAAVRLVPVPAPPARRRWGCSRGKYGWPQTSTTKTKPLPEVPFRCSP
ncbi:MAG: type II toxin-antitoxin system prevent-host-death family antitoxin [Alphaproteobacteria bacterium]|nr:type II toxin-antitoxin system prevent-host-death family antitoxin [Alphaproteobacteria bacterium]